jgi:predicted dienelactone hydrolase
MMTRTFLTLAALLLSTAAHADAPGLDQRSIPIPHAPGTLAAAIWFPANPGGTDITYAKNPVFLGTAAREGAAPQTGLHPLVLLSHGLGGNNRSMSWLAAGLADHPGSSTFDFDLNRGMDHWTRAEDLSGTIDALLADPVYGPLIDQSRISVAGFSYGGWTALSMGGLRGNINAYAAHCAADLDRSTHCQDLDKGGIDLNARDGARWNADYRDARVSRVVGIDPALTWGLTDEIAHLTTPALLVGLGAGADRLYETDTDDSGSGFAPRLLAANPQDQAVVIAPASHYTAIMACSDIGAAILVDEGEPPICTDPPGADRIDVHAQIIAKIAAFLDL